MIHSTPSLLTVNLKIKNKLGLIFSSPLLRETVQKKNQMLGSKKYPEGISQEKQGNADLPCLTCNVA